jgi:SAM-dependent methyltransferase
MYRQHMADVGNPKPAKVWDARAQQMSADARIGEYGQALIAKMDLSGCQSLLDVGCGTGAISVELSKQLSLVHGIDFSPQMLACTQNLAQSHSRTNVTCQLKSWTDDWDDVPVCDVALASRSTAVMDMEPALLKLQSKARKRIYLTSLVGGQFADARLLNIIGRQNVAPLPSPIYIINILGKIGCRPKLDYIPSASRYCGATDEQSFIDLVISGLGPLSQHEQIRLFDWIQIQGSMPAIDSALSHQWALISWES